MAPKLAVARLSKSFGDLEALRSIDLDVERGEFISRGRAERLRQDHVPAHRRRARARDRRARCCSTAARCASPAPTAASCSRTTACCRGARCSPTPSSAARSPARSAPADRKRTHGAFEARRARRLRELSSAPAFRRHAPARQSRPRARHRSGNPADGRAVRGARRADPRDHADRAAAHLGARPARPCCSSPTRSTRRCFCPTACWCSRAGPAGLQEEVKIALPRPRTLAHQAHAGIRRLGRPHLAA